LSIKYLCKGQQKDLKNNSRIVEKFQTFSIKVIDD